MLVNNVGSQFFYLMLLFGFFYIVLDWCGLVLIAVWVLFVIYCLFVGWFDAVGLGVLVVGTWLRFWWLLGVVGLGFAIVAGLWSCAGEFGGGLLIWCL